MVLVCFIGSEYWFTNWRAACGMQQWIYLITALFFSFFMKPVVFDLWSVPCWMVNDMMLMMPIMHCCNRNTKERKKTRCRFQGYMIRFIRVQHYAEVRRKPFVVFSNIFAVRFEFNAHNIHITEAGLTNNQLFLHLFINKSCALVTRPYKIHMGNS